MSTAEVNAAMERDARIEADARLAIRCRLVIYGTSVWRMMIWLHDDIKWTGPTQEQRKR
jgi:hypothetical protein